MRNSQNSEHLDASIKEVLKDASLPYSSESWDEMERLLEKDPRKYGHSIGDYSQYIIVGSLGLLLIGGILFMIFRNDSLDEGASTEVKSENIAPDTSKPVITTSIVQDSIKNEQTTDTIVKHVPTRKDSLTLTTSTTHESSTDTSGTKKSKKKKKKKSGTSDSLSKASNPAEGTNFNNNPPPVEEPAKSVRDTTR